MLTAVEAGNEDQAGGVQVQGWKCSPRYAQGGRRQLQASRLVSPFVQPQKPEQVCVPGSAGGSGGREHDQVAGVYKWEYLRGKS